MSLSNQFGAYDGEIDLFEKALDDPKGLRINYGANKSRAEHARMRLHHARGLHREQNKRVYEKDDPRWGKSEFDKLICRLREDGDGEWWVYIERYGLDVIAVEPLSEIET